MKMEHANITVGSIDEAVRFLGIAFPDCRVRGGGFIHGNARAGRWVHFGNDEFYVALQENRRPSGRNDVTYRNDGINHLGFVVKALDALLERMAAAGYRLSDASALEQHPHRRRAYFFDGNGVEWEFVEYLSDRAGDRNDYSL